MKEDKTKKKTLFHHPENPPVIQQIPHYGWNRVILHLAFKSFCLCESEATWGSIQLNSCRFCLLCKVQFGAIVC